MSIANYAEEIRRHDYEKQILDSLPWHGLDDQRYGQEARPPLANDGWMKKFNTRWVGPHTLTRTSR